MKERTTTQGPRTQVQPSGVGTHAGVESAPRTPHAPTFTPDTHPEPPMTPSGDHISVDVVSQGLRPTPVTQSAITPHDLGPAPARELSADRLSVTSQAKYSPSADLNSGEQSSNTTLQSMMRPELLQAAVSDTRRFVSIEGELSELSVSVRLLEKRALSAEKTARLALLGCGLALLVALLSWLL